MSHETISHERSAPDRHRQGFVIDTLRGQPNAQTAARRLDQVRSMRVSTGVLNAPRIEARIPQVLMVAFNEGQDEVVGVNTSYLARPQALKIDLWAYRTFVHPDYRENDVAFW